MPKKSSGSKSKRTTLKQKYKLIKKVKEHHKKVPRIAFVTDSRIGDVAESVASHFVSAEIKNFDYGELDKAEQWILGG